MNLELLPKSDIQATTFRFEADADVEASLAAFELDPQEIRAFSAQYSLPVNATTASDRVVQRFSAKRTAYPSRFSDGSIPVLYTAIEDTTARAEVDYWFRKLNGNAFPAATYYRKMRCEFEGAVVDLRPETEANAFLISANDDGYSQCIAATREALALDLDGFLTHSARLAGGVCLPVLKRDAVVSAEWDGVFQFYFNADDSPANVTLVGE